MVSEQEMEVLRKYMVWHQYLGKEMSKYKRVSNPVVYCNSCAGCGGGGCGGCGGP
ncbi:MAG: hypothetical protein LAKADJCE_00306 [Candidatus Argoarchaeum ethanivorans]|uniref:Uncharacterized protein n=1 Tax=Candidatus Argoarchaeum ethanivorans TaxID=2608793 RepID=A0A811T5B9_9EURY|nr:MAG: hypothetical protein LAKADJCE_00306 [Candidatus Argoarchaeum ethanivorans]